MPHYYENRHASKILGVRPSTLRYWATTGTISADLDSVGRPGIRRGYSLENLVEAAIARELNAKIRFPLDFVKEVLRTVRKNEGINAKFCYVVISGMKETSVVVSNNYMGVITKMTDQDGISEKINVTMPYYGPMLPGGIDDNPPVIQLKAKAAIADMLIFNNPETIIIISVHHLKQDIEDQIKKLESE